MEEPRPGGTAFVITVSSASGKYAPLPVPQQFVNQRDDSTFEKITTPEAHCSGTRRN